MAKFTLTIHTRTSHHFSHTSAGEREGVAALLQQAARQITNSAAKAGSLISSDNQIVGEYSFGEGMINQPRRRAEDRVIVAGGF
jgi:predicted neutral ceramidase superfamily lipid hydrolase